jgi:hypothetical protein
VGYIDEIVFSYFDFGGGVSFGLLVGLTELLGIKL